MTDDDGPGQARAPEELQAALETPNCGPVGRTRTRFVSRDRILDPAHFRRAFERRKPVADEILVLHTAENHLDRPRLGISIPKRRVRKATARNRIKRLLREAFRLHRSQLPSGIDLVVVPRKLDLTLADAAQSLTTLASDAMRRLRRRATL